MAVKKNLETSEIKKMEDNAECLRDRLFIRLSRWLGSRVSETLGIALEDVDFESEGIWVKKQKKRIKRECPKCGNRVAKSDILCSQCGATVGIRAGANVRSIVDERKMQNVQRRFLEVDQKTLQMIQEYANRGGCCERMEDGVVKHFLFNMSRTTAWRISTELGDKVGIQPISNLKSGIQHKVSPHQFRYALATKAADRDESPVGMKHLQEHLGHENFSTTMIYVRTNDEKHRKWLKKVHKEDGEE